MRVKTKKTLGHIWPYFQNHLEFSWFVKTGEPSIFSPPSLGYHKPFNGVPKDWEPKTAKIKERKWFWSLQKWNVLEISQKIFMISQLYWHLWNPWEKLSWNRHQNRGVYSSHFAEKVPAKKIAIIGVFHKSSLEIHEK